MRDPLPSLKKAQVSRFVLEAIIAAMLLFVTRDSMSAMVSVAVAFFFLGIGEWQISAYYRMNGNRRGKNR